MPFTFGKNELDAEEQQRNELEAVRIDRELEAELAHELCVEELPRELKSEECVRELEVGGKLYRAESPCSTAMSERSEDTWPRPFWQDIIYALARVARNESVSEIEACDRKT